MTRKCLWCQLPMPPGKRRDALTCSKRCRQARHRFVTGVGVAARGATHPTPPCRFAYADPPYPGFARRCYGSQEVDHEVLVRQLVDGFPDGWALSTHADSLRDILAMCPPDVRVCPWVRGPRPGTSYRPRNAWEPLIVRGGRLRPLSVAEDLRDTLVSSYNARQPTHPGAVVGMKPAPFCRWMFDQLGARPGDTLVDLFPGSGAVSRAWKVFTETERAHETELVRNAG